MLNNQAIDDCFRALADPARRAIVERLTQGPASVGAIAMPFDMSLSAVVQHLQILEKSGIIVTEKQGRTRTCRLRPDGLQDLSNWIFQRRAQVGRQLDRLAVVLAQTETQPAAPGPKPKSRRGKGRR